jgi:tetratricopeptide (TPR) repeat protein
LLNYDNIKAMQNVEISFEKPTQKNEVASVNVAVSNYNPAPVKDIAISYQILDVQGTKLKDSRIVIPNSVPAGDRRTFSDIELGTIKGVAAKLTPRLEMLKYGPKPRLNDVRVERFIDAASKHDKDSYTDFSDFVEVNDDFAPAWIGLGRAYAARGEWKNAVAQYKRAIQLEPENANAHYYMAVALFYMGDRSGAKKEIEKACGLAPDDPAILFSSQYLINLKDQKTSAARGRKGSGDR